MTIEEVKDLTYGAQERLLRGGWTFTEIAMHNRVVGMQYGASELRRRGRIEDARKRDAAIEDVMDALEASRAVTEARAAQ